MQVQPGRKLVPTALGISLIRGYQCIDPDLCLPDIRSFIEQQITFVAKGQAEHSRVVQHVVQQFKQKFIYFVQQVINFPISPWHYDTQVNITRGKFSGIRAWKDCFPSYVLNGTLGTTFAWIGFSYFLLLASCVILMCKAFSMMTGVFITKGESSCLIKIL